MKLLKMSLIFAAFAFAIACNQTTTDNTTANANLKPNTNIAANAAPTAPPDELASGRKHYSEKCVACHKENGTGGKVDIEGKTFDADDLTTDKMKKMDDAKYIKYIKDGIPDEGMPAFKDQLSDEQIKDVVKFIRKELQKN